MRGSSECRVDRIYHAVSECRYEPVLALRLKQPSTFQPSALSPQPSAFIERRAPIQSSPSDPHGSRDLQRQIPYNVGVIHQTKFDGCCVRILEAIKSPLDDFFPFCCLMTANTSCVFLDSSDIDPSWFQGGWSDLSNASFVGGSGKVTNGSGFLNFTNANLEGDGLAINGFVPIIDKAWTITVDDEQSNARVPNPSGASWQGMWMATSFGHVPAVISGMPEGVVVDFIALFPPFYESIKGKKVIVDDVDLLLVYTGSWEEHGAKVHEDEDQYLLAGGRMGVPYSGGSTWGKQAGDMIQFPFTGTSVSVYGLLGVAAGYSGNVTVAFSINNENTTTTSFPPPDAARIYPGFINTLYYNFFSSPPLDAGDHILTIQIMEVFEGAIFALDFIVYTAAFDSLDTMPQIHIPTSTSTPSTPPTNLTTSPSTLPSTKANVGAIAGGIVGGVISLIIVTIVTLYLLRRRREQAALGKLASDPFLDVALESEKPIYNGSFHPDDSTTMSWNEATGATTMSSVSAKLPPKIALRPAGAVSPELVAASANLVPAQRVRELEQQIQELTGQVQQLQPPAYSDGLRGQVGAS